jgi:prepilin-type N-terminal cleavage/methylation domain-containing protein
MKKLMPKLKGFTIIEVIIVLVVGAVIMLAVFLVVPQLQRTQRNSMRQNDARRLLTAAINYTTANNAYPGASTIITASIADLSTSPNLFIDPDGVPYSVNKVATTPSNIKTTSSSATVAAVNASETSRMTLNYSAKCDGINAVFIGSTDKNKIAVSVYQEPATIACFSNS